MKEEKQKIFSKLFKDFNEEPYYKNDNEHMDIETCPNCGSMNTETDLSTLITTCTDCKYKGPKTEFIKDVDI